MGVDYYNCGVCGEIFTDCGPYEICTKCESFICGWCLEDTQEKYGTGNPPEGEEGYYGEDAPDGCSNCDPEIVTDAAINKYLFKQSGKTKEELTAEILRLRKSSQ